MFESFVSELSQVKKKSNRMEKFEQKHPLLSILAFQAAVGVLLIAAVSGIAFVGGSIIWMFYRIVGAM